MTKPLAAAAGCRGSTTRVIATSSCSTAAGRRRRATHLNTPADFERTDRHFSDVQLRLFDLPGERVNDIPMMVSARHPDLAFAIWSDRTCRRLSKDLTASEYFQPYFAKLDEPGVTEADLLHTYKVALAKTRLAYRPYVSPSSYLARSQRQSREGDRPGIARQDALLRAWSRRGIRAAARRLPHATHRNGLPLRAQIRPLPRRSRRPGGHAAQVLSRPGRHRRRARDPGPRHGDVQRLSPAHHRSACSARSERHNARSRVAKRLRGNSAHVDGGDRGSTESRSSRRRSIACRSKIGPA